MGRQRIWARTASSTSPQPAASPNGSAGSASPGGALLLRDWKLSKLRKRVEDAGVSDSTIASALEAEDPKGELISLIRSHDPEPLPPSAAVGVAAGMRKLREQMAAAEAASNLALESMHHQLEMGPHPPVVQASSFSSTSPPEDAPSPPMPGSAGTGGAKPGAVVPNWLRAARRTRSDSLTHLPAAAAATASAAPAPAPVAPADRASAAQPPVVAALSSPRTPPIPVAKHSKGRNSAPKPAATSSESATHRPSGGRRRQPRQPPASRSPTNGAAAAAMHHDKLRVHEPRAAAPQPDFRPTVRVSNLFATALATVLSHA